MHAPRWRPAFSARPYRRRPRVNSPHGIQTAYASVPIAAAIANVIPMTTGRPTDRRRRTARITPTAKNANAKIREIMEPGRSRAVGWRIVQPGCGLKIRQPSRETVDRRAEQVRINVGGEAQSAIQERRDLGGFGRRRQVRDPGQPAQQADGVRRRPGRGDVIGKFDDRRRPGRPGRDCRPRPGRRWRQSSSARPRHSRRVARAARRRRHPRTACSGSAPRFPIRG